MGYIKKAQMYFIRGLMVVIALAVAIVLITMAGVPLSIVFMSVEVPLAFTVLISIVVGLIVLGWSFTIINIRRKR